MKNLKKFAALLLAGAMALLMLTACGGGGGDFGKRDPDAEDKAFNRFTSMTQASGLKENDKSLQAVAEGHLREDLNSSIEILGAKLVAKVHVDGVKEDYAIVTVTANYVYSDTLLSALLKAIEDSTKVPIGVKANVNQNGTWSKVGVVILTNNEQSYIGLSIRVENPHK